MRVPVLEEGNNRLVRNMATAAFNRWEVWEGKTYLVAPCVALVGDTIVNGELIPYEELAKYPESWNGIPIPIHHPQDSSGEYVSANSPGVLEEHVVGRFFNVTASSQDRKLRGEIWVDIEKCTRLGGEAQQALDHLKAGKPLEVSTAYFRDGDTAVAADGDQVVVQRNLRPDHLALLPNGVGACSWSDGAGAPRVNNRYIVMNNDGTWVWSDPTSTNTTEESEAPNGNTQEQEDDNGGECVMIENVLEKLKTYSNDTLTKISELLSNSEEAEIIQRLDAAPAESQSEEPEPGKAPETETGKVEEEEEEEEEPEPVQLDFDAWVESIPDDTVREEMLALRQRAQEHRKTLLDSLVSNKRCQLDKDDLETMKTNQLEKLDKSLRTEDYSGKGGPRTNKDDDEIPAPPSVLLAKKEVK